MVSSIAEKQIMGGSEDDKRYDRKKKTERERVKN